MLQDTETKSGEVPASSIKKPGTVVKLVSRGLCAGQYGMIFQRQAKGCEFPWHNLDSDCSNHMLNDATVEVLPNGYTLTVTRQNP